MTSFFPGPYTLELEYIVDGLSHVMALNLDLENPPNVGDAFNAISPAERGVVTQSLVDVTNDLEVNLQAIFSTNMTAVGWTLWQNVPLSYERNYISALAASFSGTNGATYEPARQLTYTYRTQGGGIMKMVLLEVPAGPDTRSSLAAATGVHEGIRNYILGTNSPFIGRDNQFPIAALNLSGGQNEAVWRKRFRS